MRNNTTLRFTALLSMIFLIGSLAACKNIKPPTREASYEIERIEEGIKLTLNISGDQDGQTEFKIGDNWADEKTPHERFKNITSAPHELSLDEETLTVTHPSGVNLAITWELHSDDGRNASEDPTYFFAPVITKEYIHLIGYTALITPMNADPVQVTFGGTALREAEGKILSPLWKTKDTIQSDTLISGFSLLGNIDTARSADGHLSVGISQGVDISAAELVSELEPILTSLADVWGAPLIDYSVTLQSLDPAIGSVLAGTAFPGGFAAAATPNIATQLLSGFLTHEAAHEWVPNRLGAPEFEGSGREPEGYWISEGFTQLLSRKAQLKAGSIDMDGYAALLNQDMRELYMLPTREFTNAQIGKSFWTNQDVERLPYLRGFLLAAKWDQEISIASNGTKGMIDVLKAIEKKNNGAEDGIKLTSDIVVEHVKNMGAKDPQADIAAFIIKGMLFEPNPNMLGNGFSLIESELAPYDVGFDTDKTFQTGVFEGVTEQSSAYRAGLRNGMTFISKKSGGGGDTSVPLIMQVEHKGQQIEISYKPTSNDKVKVPQFIKVE